MECQVSDRSGSTSVAPSQEAKPGLNLPQTCSDGLKEAILFHSQSSPSLKRITSHYRVLKLTGILRPAISVWRRGKASCSFGGAQGCPILTRKGDSSLPGHGEPGTNPHRAPPPKLWSESCNHNPFPVCDWETWVTITTFTLSTGWRGLWGGRHQAFHPHGRLLMPLGNTRKPLHPFKAVQSSGCCCCLPPPCPLREWSTGLTGWGVMPPQFEDHSCKDYKATLIRLQSKAYASIRLLKPHAEFLPSCFDVCWFLFCIKTFKPHFIIV